MRLKFVVKAKKSWPRFHRDAIEAATKWGVNELLLNDRGTMVVKMIKHGDFSGQAVQLHEGNYIVHVSSNKDVHEVLSTVFHELTHVKQYIQDGFDMTKDSAVWKGKSFKITGTFWNYWKSPWEKEARKMEKRLLKRYLEE